MTTDFQIQADPDGVRLWLAKRLPLEPIGSILDARTQLRTAIRNLRIPQGQVLSAAYTSLDCSFFDVENVLIYNVGTGTFRDCATNGIVFFRRRAVPPSSHSGNTLPHFHDYTYTDAPTRPIGPLSYCFEFKPPPLTTTTKLQDVWWRAADASCGHSQSLTSPFSIHVEITTNRVVTNVAAIVKPFLDGIICGMQGDSNPNPDAVQRLAAKCNWDPQEITRKLRNSAVSALGNRRLVDCYRDYVKWDPVDHLCESCTFIIRSGNEQQCSVTVSPHG